jgi:hypothetical protein
MIRFDEAFDRERQTPLKPLAYTFHLTADKPPVDDRRVRQALAASLDREALCYEVFGLGVPAQGLAPPGVFGSTHKNMDFNPEFANLLLDEAGYYDEDGDGFRESYDGSRLSLNMVFTTPSDYHLRMAEVVAEMWAAHLGVEVSLEGMELDDLTKILVEEPHESDRMPHVWRYSWLQTIPDQHYWLSTYFSDLRVGYTFWRNPDFNGILQSAAAEPDQGIRQEYYQIAEEILLREDPAVIPVCHWTYNFLSKTNVHPTYSLPFGLGSIAEWGYQTVPGQPPRGPDEPVISVPDTTTIVEEDTIEVFSQISDDQTELVFSNWTADLRALDVDDIIVMDQNDLAEYGLLRRVVEIYEREGEITLTTIPALLDEAVEEMAFDYATGLDWEDVYVEEDLVSTSSGSLHLAKSYPANLDDAFKIKIDHILDDADGDENTTDDQVRIKGSIKIKPDFKLDIDIKHHQLEKLTFISTIDEKAELEIYSNLPLVDFHKKIPIKRFTFMPQTIAVGYFPVVITPQLTIFAGFDGSISAKISSGISQEDTIIAGLEYSNGNWHKRLDDGFDPNFKMTLLDLTQECRAQIYAGPELSLLVYGVAGPYSNLKGYIKLELDPSKAPSGKLTAGLKADAGVKFKIFKIIDVGYELTVFDLSKVLYPKSGVTVSPTTTPTPPNGNGCICPSVYMPLVPAVTLWIIRHNRISRKREGR